MLPLLYRDTVRWFTLEPYSCVASVGPTSMRGTTEKKCEEYMTCTCFYAEAELVPARAIPVLVNPE